MSCEIPEMELSCACICMQPCVLTSGRSGSVLTTVHLLCRMVKSEKMHHDLFALYFLKLVFI